MTRRTWLFLAAALFAISALATYGTVANASLPTTSGTLGAQSVSVAAAAPQQQSKDQPFNCAQIDALGINKQMNLHAAEIMTQCGRGKEVLPQQAVKGSGGDFSPTVYGGPDVNVHPPTSPSIQSESFSWRHGSTIVVAYNDLGTCTGNVSTSTDGGATFAVTGNGVFCTGHGTNFGDPAVSFDPVRNKWIAEFLASGCGGQGVGAWNSTDGITWATAGCAANVGSGSGDRNSAWTDNNPSSPFYGRSYISYNDFSIGGGALRTAFSTDGGTTWSTPVTVVGSFQRDIQMSGDLTGSNGYAYLAGMDEGGGGAANRTNYMHRSTDGGLTWNQIQQNPPYAPPGAAVCSGNSYFYTITPQIRHMGWGQPVVGAAGVVHYVYAQHGTGADEGNIMYTRSTDFGATWSTPIQLNTDAGLRAQWMPSVGATSGGGVFVKWYDRRNTANNDYEIYGRQSNDNGLTWQLDAAVSDAVIPMPIVQTANCYDGDYDYWQGDGTNIQGSWTDSRGSGSGGTQDVFHDGVTGAGGTATPTSTGTPPTATLTATLTSTPTATATICGGQPSWQAGPDQSPGRYTLQGAVATDGNFYVVGGQDASNTVVPDFSRYNTASNNWTSLGNMAAPAGQIAVGTSGNKIYVAGGFVDPGITSTLRIYDIPSNTWTFGASMPGSTEASAGVVLSGKFYVIGGDTLTVSLNTNYIYDIATNTWTSGAPLPDVRTNLNGTTAGGLVYVYGGGDAAFAAVNTLYSYNPGTNSWATLAPNPGEANEGNYAPITTYGAGLLITAGGSDTTFVPHNMSFVYNIAGDTWSAAANLTTARTGHAIGTLNDGRVIVYSGLSAAAPNAVTTSTEILSPRPPCVTTTPTATNIAATATRTNTAVPPTSTQTNTVAVPTSTNTTVLPSATDTAMVATETATSIATATACTITFSDVPPDHPFYTWIRCLACRGIISGYSDNTFRPGNDITRGQIAKMVSKAAGFEEDPGPQIYEDVAPGSPFYDWINRLTNRGYMGGYDCGLVPEEPCVPPGNRPYFRPSANATRGQLSKIVSNAAGLGGTPTGTFYTDVPEGHPFYLWIMRLTDLGVMSGYPCGGAGEPCDDQQRPYFRPFNNVTRGQASKIVANTFLPDCQTPGYR